MRNVLLGVLAVAYLCLAVCDITAGQYRTAAISTIFALANYLIFF